ncbi:unnamed protein product [Pseudo-nitzschia multistriata]|uniref:Uncharacterized protein n=1 Tax=Pseudo-nitzschia multistriata TaxID=183589 RepID=A0A448ZE89_9STRA|nr:unnamed protein product [Pseudo-nitzschia multistriata]
MEHWLNCDAQERQHFTSNLAITLYCGTMAYAFAAAVSVSLQHLLVAAIGFVRVAHGRVLRPARAASIGRGKGGSDTSKDRGAVFGSLLLGLRERNPGNRRVRRDALGRLEGGLRAPKGFPQSELVETHHERVVLFVVRDAVDGGHQLGIAAHQLDKKGFFLHGFVRRNLDGRVLVEQLVRQEMVLRPRLGRFEAATHDDRRRGRAVQFWRKAPRNAAVHPDGPIEEPVCRATRVAVGVGVLRPFLVPIVHAVAVAAVSVGYGKQVEALVDLVTHVEHL